MMWVLAFYQACRVRKVPQPQRILHSPLVRAAQTAEIIAGAFSRATVSTVMALQPGSPVVAVDAAVSGSIESNSYTQHVLLVSHQPLLSRLVEHYLAGTPSVPFLPPGGLVTLSLEVIAPACATLLFWAFPPEYEAGV
jgi:phosphohistidine phosphatase